MADSLNVTWELRVDSLSKFTTAVQQMTDWLASPAAAGIVVNSRVDVEDELRITLQVSMTPPNFG